MLPGAKGVDYSSSFSGFSKRCNSQVSSCNINVARTELCSLSNPFVANKGNGFICTMSPNCA